MKTMKNLALLLSAAMAAALSHASPETGLEALLSEAATLAEAGKWTEAAAAAALAERDPDATDAMKARAANAALNYYSESTRKEVADNRRIRLNSLFSDHAVLQRGKPIPVWGRVDQGKFITIGLGGVWLSAKANESGYFKIIFPAMEAGGPHRLEAFCDGETFTAEDIYIGEVWLAGGQSNMEMPLTGYGVPVPQEDYAALSAKQPVRMLKVDKCNDAVVREDSGAKWMTSWKGNEKVWSAAASFFAYRLADKLDCPVGIVLCAYSGSRAETWLTFDALYNLESTRKGLCRYEYSYRQEIVVDDNKPYYSRRYGLTGPAYTGIMKDLEKRIPDIDLDQKAEGRELPGFDDSDWKRVKVPGHWYNTLGKANGIAWFRKTVAIPEGWAGKELILSLGAVDKQDRTYFNGTLVGETGKGWEHQYWGTKRLYRIPAELVKSGKAVIAVRVFSMADGAGLFGPAEEMKLSCGGESIDLAGEDWAAAITVNIGQREGSSRAYRHQPHFMADSMLSSVIPYAIRGVIWYQGCSNSGRANYGEVMEALITEWRRRWNQPDMAFIQVLLAGFAPGRGYEEIRQKQMESAKATGSWFVSAVDRGHANIHPPYKKDVGERLALRALGKVYGVEEAGAEYPEFKSLAYSNGTVAVTFSNAAGLYAKDGEAAGFEIAGEKEFAPAKAEIRGQTVAVKVPEGIKQPKWIRYAWKPDPAEANLYNSAKLPALPFKAEIRE